MSNNPKIPLDNATEPVHNEQLTNRDKWSVFPTRIVKLEHWCFRYNNNLYFSLVMPEPDAMAVLQILNNSGAKP
jgi:hypothetical protein